MIVRTERALRHQQMADILLSAGYTSIGKPLLPPWRLLAVLTIACNTIAEMMSVHPYRVFHALYVRLIEATRGAKHVKRMSDYVRAGEHQDVEELHVYCPCCGQDLLAAGPPTMEEIAEGKARAAAMRRKTARKSPQSGKSEGRVSPSVGNAVAGTGTVTGAGGTGGGDPAGAVLPNVPPHSPSH